jgi:hypothetical protein
MARGWTLTSPQLTENDVEHACLDLVRVRGYYVIRLHAGTFKTADGKRWIKGVDPGTPDYICVHPVYPGFFLETKRPGADLSWTQKSKIDELYRVYRLAVVAVDSAAALNGWIDEHEAKPRGP